MTIRSLPRLTPGAKLGAHRNTKLTIVANDGPEEVQAAGQAATPADSALPPPARAAGTVWLSDILVPERNSFGVLRLLMALAVLVSHAYFIASGQSTAEPLYRWTGYTLGQHGVQVFFFLSGILVAQSLMKSESVRDYAIARGLRIFPALIVCVLLTALVLGPWLTTLPAVAFLKDKLVATYILKTLSLMTGSAPLPGVFESAPGAAKGVVNSSLWTLKYEVLCYMALAMVGWIAIRTKAYREVAVVAIAAWLGLVLTQPVGIEIGSQKSAFEVFRYFALFFGAGAVAYSLRHWIPVHGLIFVPLLGLMIAAIGTRYAEPAMAIALGYGALWLATFDFWGLRGYTNHSDYSYGTYIYAMPVSQAILQFIPGVHPVSLSLITAGIVVFLAFLSWEMVERPALALRHRFRQREVSQPDRAAALPGEPEIPRSAPKPPRQPVVISAERTKIAAAPAPAPAPAPAAIRDRGPAHAAHQSELPAPQTVDVAAEPGVAHRWRPISKPIRLKVARDGDAPEASVDATPADIPADRLRHALDR